MTDKCFCKCGRHHNWTVVRTIDGEKRWFLNTDHLKHWEDSRSCDFLPQQEWADGRAPHH